MGIDAAAAAGAIGLETLATGDLIMLNYFLLGRKPNGEWEYSPAEHHEQIADIIHRVDNGELRRVIISCPPQFGKSQHTTESAPLYHIGRAEMRGERVRIGIASFAQARAVKASVKMRDAIESGRLARIFPKLKLKPGSQTKAEWETEGGSSVTAVGVGSAFTGTPCDIIYVDDPYAGWEEAMSPAISEGVWNWYLTVCRPRLQGGGRMVIIHTRWKKADLAGMLIEQDNEGIGDGYHVFNMPAIIDEGTPQERSLWPARFSLDYLRKTRAISGVVIWNTIYQQRPMENVAGETLGEPNRMDTEPKLDKVFGYVDPAYDGDDRTSMCTGGRLGDGRILVTRGRSWRKNATRMGMELAALHQDADCGVSYVEDNKDEGYTGNVMEEHGARTLPKRNTKNKLGRIYAHVRRKWDKIVFGPHVDPDWLTRVCEWYERADHDDEVDSLAGLVELLTESDAVEYTDF